MGMVEWFKKTFGKQPCAFCGAEVGMLKRTKIKDKSFICNECSCGCSRYIQRYRYTKDELLGHMEYMKRQGSLYAQLEGKFTLVVPSATIKQSVEFYDNHGLFRIRHRDGDSRYAKEFIRYDQVASYEPYLEESEPEEQGKPKEFGECGVDITLVGGQTDLTQLPKGLRAHPYITETIRVCVNDRDRHTGELEVNQIIHHFDMIFGVRDNTKGLFNFGPTKQQRREGAAAVAMAGMFGAAIQAAKDGEVSEETKEKVQEAMNKVEDAATSGLAEYSRRADAAESLIN